VELLKALERRLPIVVVLEVEDLHMPLSRPQLYEQMRKLDQPVVDAGGEPICDARGKQFPSMYHKWGLIDEATGRCCTEDEKDPVLGPPPVAGRLYAQVFPKDVDPIEWCRLGTYQDVSMRLIAERILLKPELRGKIVLQGELSFQRPTLPMPSAGKRYHVCHSPHNRGATTVLNELQDTLGLHVEVTGRLEEVEQSERFVLYLTKETWTQSAEAEPEALARDVERALDAGTKLLLVHECPGIDMDVSTGGVVDMDVSTGRVVDMDVSTGRGALSFDEVILKTPQHLLTRGIYACIATGLKAGAWRRAGIVSLALDLAGHKQDRRRHVLMEWVQLLGGCGEFGTGAAGLLARLRQGRRTLEGEEGASNGTLLSRGGRVVYPPSVQLSGHLSGRPSARLSRGGSGSRSLDMIEQRSVEL